MIDRIIAIVILVNIIIMLFAYWQIDGKYRFGARQRRRFAGQSKIGTCEQCVHFPVCSEEGLIRAEEEACFQYEKGEK